MPASDTDSTPSWRSPGVKPKKRRAFLQEITVGNLRRMFWFILVYLPISVGILIYNGLAPAREEINFWSYLDIGLALVFLFLTVVARRRERPLGWRYGLVLVYSVYCLVTMTGYYFATYPHFGENQAYTLGVLMVAVLFRLPPRWFLPLFVVNHLVFSGLLWRMGLEQSRLVASLVGGLDGLLVGLLAAYFLFSREWRLFTQRRLLDQRNREMARVNARLQQRNQELDELMAIAAHDLRSPLLNMRKLFELLQTEPEWQAAPHQRVLSDCSVACGDMLGLIRRLLDAHAAEHERKGLSLQQVSTARLMREATQRFFHLASARSIRFVTTFPATEEALISTDLHALEQALDNLLSNAVKFSPSNASIHLTLTYKEGRHLLEIGDEGPGVPPEERDRLFDKFYRGSSLPETDTDTPGTGLGLFIVKQMMENLGGTVTYRPRRPHGAIFRLTIPSRNTTPALNPSAQESPSDEELSEHLG